MRRKGKKDEDEEKRTERSGLYRRGEKDKENGKRT